MRREFQCDGCSRPSCDDLSPCTKNNISDNETRRARRGDRCRTAATDYEAYLAGLLASAMGVGLKIVEKVIPKAKLTTTADHDEAVKAVMEGRADALVVEFPICTLTLLRHPDAGLATLGTPLTIEPIGIALPPGDSLLVNMLTNHLGALEGTGLLEVLEKKWFEDGFWLLQVP